MVKKKIWESNFDSRSEELVKQAWDGGGGFRWGGQRAEEARKVPIRCFSDSKEIQSEVNLSLNTYCK